MTSSLPTVLVASAPLRLDLAGRELEPLAPLVVDAAVVSWPLAARPTVRVELRSEARRGLSRVVSLGRFDARRSAESAHDEASEEPLGLEVDVSLDPPGDEGPLGLEAWALRTLPPPWPVVVRVEGPRERDLGGASAIALALCAALERARGESRDDLVELARGVAGRATGEPEPRAGIASARVGAPRVGVRRLGEATIVAAPQGGGVAALLRSSLVLLRDAAARSGPTARGAARAVLDGSGRTRAALARAAEASRALAEAVLLDRAESVAPLVAREAEALEEISPTSQRDREVSEWLARAGAAAVRRLGEAGLVLALANEGRADAVRAAAVECGLAPVDSSLGTGKGLAVEEAPA